MVWHLTILSCDGQRLIFACACDDLETVKGLASEARAWSLTLQIWIRPPFDRVYRWC
jgi:hypothetical protein